MLDLPSAPPCDQLLSPITWSSSTESISACKQDDLPLLEESIALEAACGDLDALVIKFKICVFAIHYVHTEHHLYSLQEDLMESCFMNFKANLPRLQHAFYLGNPMKIPATHLDCSFCWFSALLYQE